jgi:hypothetical protein
VTTAELEELPMAMLLPASRLVEAVHAYDIAASHEVLEPLNVMQLRALAVDLAALVPVGDVAAEALALIAASTPR